jgi:hypothetical protein
MALYYLTRTHILAFALSLCSVLASFPAAA